MPGRMPSHQEVLGYFSSLSNWGRWGPEDELGTLNFITPQKRREAAATVRDGISIGCARLIPKQPTGPNSGLRALHFMTASGDVAGAAVSADFVGVEYHVLSVTHVDALAHIFWDGRMYNNRPSTQVTTTEGAKACSVEPLKDGVVTRGVLLDIPRLRGQRFLEPSEIIFPEDLEAAERAQGVRVGEGDALLVYTAWSSQRVELGTSAELQRPYLCPSVLPWLHERRVAVLGHDGAQDGQRSPVEPWAPVHQIGVVKMGLCLLDNLELEPLADACQQRSRWESLFTFAPLRFEFATGSPTTPVAVL